MIKKLLIIAVCATLLTFGMPMVANAGKLTVIEEFKGLQTNPGADKIEIGAHSTFDNAFIQDRNIKVIKGRDRLNDTAHVDTTVNAMCYYESQDGATKKIVVKESDEIVSYNVDGTNRTEVIVNRIESGPGEFGEDTELMLHFNGDDASTLIIDSSLNAHSVIAIGDAQLDTTDPKFGSADLELDGSGDYVTYSMSALGTEDFTIDFQAKLDAHAGEPYFFIGSVFQGLEWKWHTTAGGRFDFAVDSVTASIAFATTTGSWKHYAMVRASGTVTIYVDGVSKGAFGASGNVVANTFDIGGNSAITAATIDGHMDEFRITKGVALWTENFTPPTQETQPADESSSSGVDLTDEATDCVQIGDVLYLTSSTDGIIKWAGSGDAHFLEGITLPTVPNFTVNTGVKGALTSGNDAIFLPSLAAFDCGITNVNYVDLASHDRGGVDIDCDTGDVGVEEVCATTIIYKYKVTKYNSVWGIESEPSESDSVTLEGGNTVTWSAANCGQAGNCSSCTNITFTTTDAATSVRGIMSTSIDTPFDKYRIYRTTASGSDYFLIGDAMISETYVDSDNDIALGQPLDTTIDTINSPTFRYIENYKGILFIAEGTEARFTRIAVDSETDADKYWLETDQIQTGAQFPITGLHTTKNSLLIFTSARILELTGFGVETFRLRQVAIGFGAVSDATIETDNNGDIIFFAGTQGVYKIRTSDTRTDELLGALVDQNNAKIVRISSPALEDVFNGTDSDIVLDVSTYSNSHSYYDQDNNLYWLFVDEDAFVFNNLSDTWSHVTGVKTSASIYRRSPSSQGQGMLLDDVGYMWDNFKTFATGGESGTVTGSPTSGANTTLTDTGATFNTTDDGESGVWVTVDNGTTLQHRRIASNTATVLTVDAAWDTNPTTSDTYYIGYISFDILTKQYSITKPPKLIEVQALTLVHEKAPSAQDITMSIYKNKSTTAESSKTFDLADNFLDKKIISATGLWVHWGLRAFVHNTTDSENYPVNITNYSIRAYEREEA